MKRVAVALIALWLPASAGSPVHNGSRVTGWPIVEQVFHQQVHAAGIVSSVLFVRDGTVVATATDGYQDARHHS